MNKQEFQQKIKDMKPPKFFTAITLSEAYKRGFEEAKGNVLFNSNFLDESEKPVVPKYVANWYEENKDNFEYSIQCLCVQGCEPVRQIDIWFDNDDNKPIVTLVKMKLFGYEVEKEKLYTVEIPNPNDFVHTILHRTEKGIIISYSTDENYKNIKQNQLTEAEIKQDFDWAWQFAKEIE